MGIWGIQQKSESLISQQLTELGMKVLRLTYCSLDEWINFDWKSITELELNLAEKIIINDKNNFIQRPEDYVKQLQTNNNPNNNNSSDNHSNNNNNSNNQKSRYNKQNKIKSRM